MDIQFAKWIKNAMENAGEECEIREEYSGRGMYGNKTAGVVVDNVMVMITVLISEAYNNGLEDGDCDDDIEDQKNKDYGFLEDFPLLRRDSMGKQTIIY